MSSRTDLPLPVTETVPSPKDRSSKFYKVLDTFKMISRYVKRLGLDILALFTILGLTAVFMNLIPLYHARKRKFPMWLDTKTGLWHGELRYSYPQSSLIISSAMCLVYVTLIPIAGFLLMQIRTRSLRDFLAALFGLFQALALTSCFMAAIKQLIGEPRPYFLTYCRPNPERLTTMALEQSSGHGLPVRFPIFADISICDRPFHQRRGFSQYDDITNAMQSFPSGHTANAFAAFTFLSLYLMAKLKAFSGRRTAFWKTICVVAPLAAAVVMATTVIVDRNHHVHDVLLSVPIGLLFGALAYKAQFRSLFNPRNNHIASMRSTDDKGGQEASTVGRNNVHEAWPNGTTDVEKPAH